MFRRSFPRVALLVLVAAIGVAACTPAVAPSGSPFAADLVARHNTIRAQYGLVQLARDGNADAHAQFEANRLQANRSCSNLVHSSTAEMLAWYPGVGVRGENLACVQNGTCSVSAQQLMDLWMASPEHRANILGTDYRYIGVGSTCDGSRTYVAVQFHS